MLGLSITKRTVAVILAAGLAGAATFGLLTYVRGIENRALRATDAVQTLVAKEVIPVGTSGTIAISKGMIGRATLPRLALLEGQVRSLSEIKEKVAAVTIYKGEQIVQPRFVNATALRGLQTIPADRQALSVEVAPPPGVAGFVKTGDRISIIANVDGGGETRVQYLLQDIQVLAVGNQTTNAQTKEPGGLAGAAAQQQQQKVLLTLAVTPVEAEKLVLALMKGQVYFTLLPPDQKPVGTPGRTPSNVFS